MATNITTCNNLVVSANQTISGNIISNANIQTTNITSTKVNNSNSISTKSINATTGALTNLSVSNLLTLLSNTPISFNYNGTNYNISALMLFRLQELGEISIASRSYVNQQISSIINSSPELLNTLSELAAAINNDASFSTTMTNLIATKSSLSGNNIFTGSNNFAYDVSGNIISRLFSTIVSINNGNTRRNVNNYFEVGMGQTSSYIYYDNSGKFGSVNTIDSNLNWNIALNSVFTIKTINSTTENVGTLNVSTSSTFSNLPYFINTSDQLINKAA